MVKMAKQQGVIQAQESEYIRNVFRFADRDAYTIMTHRNDIEWLDVHDSVEDNEKKLRLTGYTKFLVCDGTIENILGVVKLRDYIENFQKPGFHLRQILTQPLYVPETMNALNILERFRKSRNYFAVVVDEYGSIQGIITLHDLTENIFGALPDIDDSNEPNIVAREDGSWLVDGSTPVDELQDILALKDLEQTAEDYSTLAGYILYKINEIPKTGDCFDAEGFRFEIVDMDKSKIDKVLIRQIGQGQVSQE